MSTSVSSRVGSGANNGADALRGATAAADHPPEVAGADEDVEADPPAVVGGVDAHAVGVVDDRR